jgi:hypothetical protein
MILFEAIQLGNDSIVEYIFEYGISKGQNLIHELHSVESAIQCCCSSGFVGTLRLIIEKCSKYNVSVSPHLHGSVCQAISCGRNSIVDVLLSASANVDSVFLGKTALQAAIEMKTGR